MASSIASRVRARHAAKNYTNLHMLADAVDYVESLPSTPSTFTSTAPTEFPSAST